jgi:hypothetical protein
MSARDCSFRGFLNDAAAFAAAVAFQGAIRLARSGRSTAARSARDDGMNTAIARSAPAAIAMRAVIIELADRD